VDDQRQGRRELADGVVDGHGRIKDLNGLARRSFSQKPHRPWFELEIPPYMDAEVRHNLYAVLLGGGHYFFHNDEAQETRTTGIMGYDPHVKNSRLDKVRQRLAQLGIAANLLNRQVDQLVGMQPDNEIIIEGTGYCLARPGTEYVVYIREGGQALLDLGEPASQYQIRLVNPRTGEDHANRQEVDGNRIRLFLPDAGDWLIHLRLSR
jgi:hypothetical protein